MPFIFAGIGIERDDRGDEEIVALTLTTDFVVPWGAVADADQYLVELAVIDDRVPYSAAAAELAPVAVPRCAGAFYDAVRRCAIGGCAGGRWDGVEAPVEIAGVGIIGGDITAHAIFGAAIADQYAPLHHARRAGDGVGLGLIDGYLGPDGPTGGGIERDQAAVDGAEEDLAVIDSDAAIDDIAAGVEPGLSGNLRIIAPQRLASGGVESEHFAPRSRGIEYAIDDDGRRFLSAVGVEFVGPGEAEGVYVISRNLVEAGEALFLIGAAMRHPVIRIIGGGEQPRLVHNRCACPHRAPATGQRQHGGRHQQQQFALHRSLPSFPGTALLPGRVRFLAYQSFTARRGGEANP